MRASGAAAGVRQPVETVLHAPHPVGADIVTGRFELVRAHEQIIGRLLAEQGLERECLRPEIRIRKCLYHSREP